MIRTLFRRIAWWIDGRSRLIPTSFGFNGSPLQECRVCAEDLRSHTPHQVLHCVLRGEDRIVILSWRPRDPRDREFEKK